ncbi:MAG: D-TA family PLP-dependent enzyme [Clostridia bacterium]|nr:D-TA family PLP-dependent enzyme [Clostridia bacterium]
MGEDALYRLKNEGEIASPALIYYPDIIRENTRLTVAMAGSAARLWPHVKSHKTAELIDMQMDMGIRRFKCATIAELALVCSRGAEHALLAYPLVGPAIGRFLDTAASHPQTTCYALGDSMEALSMLNEACAARNTRVNWLCDVNLGMDRTGVPLDELAAFCQAAAERFERLRFVGLHCYDGQNHQSDLSERQAAVKEQMGKVAAARAALRAAGVETPLVIAGGSPSLPCHAAEEGAFLSPGTVFLWDWGYQKNFPDLPFTPGAALLTRVVSHPAPGVFTLDLGSKAIAADPAGQRGYLLEGKGAHPLFQSEEHWTWRMPEGREAERPAIGQVMYVIPTHICPTTALHRAVKLGVDGQATGEWVVAARNRD